MINPLSTLLLCSAFVSVALLFISTRYYVKTDRGFAAVMILIFTTLATAAATIVTLIPQLKK